jgi:hypothetical protein
MSDQKQIKVEFKETETTNYVVQEGYNISKGTVYLGVSEFLWTVGILVSLFCGLLGLMWNQLNKQIDKSSDGDSDIYNKIDEEAERFKEGINRIDDKFEGQRKEHKDDIQRLDDRIWENKGKTGK